MLFTVYIGGAFFIIGLIYIAHVYFDATRHLMKVTIENAVYIVMKNDLAFVITGTLNLYEHQSTCNPNMRAT